MQIFTIEMLIEMRLHAKELANTLLGSILDAAWQSVIVSFGDLTQAIQAHDWGVVLVSCMIISSAVLLLLRFVRRYLFRVVNILTDQF